MFSFVSLQLKHLMENETLRLYFFDIPVGQSIQTNAVQPNVVQTCSF